MTQDTEGVNRTRMPYRDWKVAVEIEFVKAGQEPIGAYRYYGAYGRARFVMTLDPSQVGMRAFYE